MAKGILCGYFEFVFHCIIKPGACVGGGVCSQRRSDAVHINYLLRHVTTGVRTGSPRKDNNVAVRRRVASRSPQSGDIFGGQDIYRCGTNGLHVVVIIAAAADWNHGKPVGCSLCQPGGIECFRTLVDGSYLSLSVGG